MPRAELPTTLLGWLIALGAGVIGFLAGFLFILTTTRMLGGR